MSSLEVELDENFRRQSQAIFDHQDALRMACNSLNSGLIKSAGGKVRQFLTIKMLQEWPKMPRG